ncbi:MAG TPA: methyltransferase [Terriglobales bacterium]|nr:methyltransferase [Terriglobales bacterium]
MSAQPLPADRKAPPQSTPQERLLQTALGYMLSQALYVAAKLRVADHLASGPKTTGELARSTGANEDRLYRVLRALVSAGIFSEVAPRKFANNDISSPLDTQKRDAVYDMVVWMADKFHFDAYGEMLYAVKSGNTVCQRVFGGECFEVLERDHEEGAVFNQAMTAFSAMMAPAVLEAYDFSGIGTLVDVAGGHGFILTSILQKYPGMKGILFDLEHVVAGATERIAACGVENRCERASGDFFKAVPSGDAYVMKHIIHDWDDEKAITILKNIRTAMGSRKPGKVMLIEAVLSSGSEPHFAKLLDLEMFMLPGGRERTEAEFASLFDRSGFRMTRVVPTKSPVCVVEAVAK